MLQSIPASDGGKTCGLSSLKLETLNLNNFFSIIFRARFSITFCNHFLQSLFLQVLVCNHFSFVFNVFKSFLFVVFLGLYFLLLFVFVCSFRLECLFVFVILSVLWWRVFCRVGCDLFFGVVVVFHVGFFVVWLWCFFVVVFVVCFVVGCCALSLNLICVSSTPLPSLSSPET